jgi:hypothetical protein
MAVLDPIHWEAITPRMRDLMRAIGANLFRSASTLLGWPGGDLWNVMTG